MKFVCFIVLDVLLLLFVVKLSWRIEYLEVVTFLSLFVICYYSSLHNLSLVEILYVGKSFRCEYLALCSEILSIYAYICACDADFWIFYIIYQWVKCGFVGYKIYIHEWQFDGSQNVFQLVLINPMDNARFNLIPHA